jgi:cobalt-zinc-cadmium efflux system outer membrane protein
VDKRILPLLVLTLGCQASRVDVPCAVEQHVQAVALLRATLELGPTPVADAPGEPGSERLDLPALWGLALDHNPLLRESAADIEAARGRWIQAGLYPNPRLHYDEDTIGSRLARQGNFLVQVGQEIVTAGKLKLEKAVAWQETSAASVALVGKKFEVLTRIRRAYYDYLGLRFMAEMNAKTVAALERGREITRQQVEKARSRPQTDLLRLEALLEEARITQTRIRDTLVGAWRQLAAEVGVPELPHCGAVEQLPDQVPAWCDELVRQRVLNTNTALKYAAVEVERARIAVARARAEAVPNVTFGGGYTADNTDQTAGGLITLEMPLPVWDRKQGLIHENKAKLAAAQALVQSTTYRLTHDTAEALARYQATKQQVERLNKEVLPRLEQSLDLVSKAYLAGSAQVTFSDLLLTEQNLNTARLSTAEARRSLWLAIADLQGLMQLDIDEECVDPQEKGIGSKHDNPGGS